MTGWAPSFFRRSPLFAPIARAASAFEGSPAWPQPEELARAFEGAPAVRFEIASPHARYDERIALDGVVPTRPGSWHDFLNALVWGTFPRAKRALHARQHRMIAARRGDDARLPNARTKEQDAVAMFDEGGVALVCVPEAEGDARRAIAERAGDVAQLIADGRAGVVVFGHAIFEHLVRGGPMPVRGAAYVLRSDAGEVDEGLAALLGREAPISRAEFGCVRIDETLERAIAPWVASAPAAAYGVARGRAATETP